MPSESTPVSLRRAFNPWAIPVVDDVVERKCTCCHEEWPLDEDFWYRDGKNKDGFTTQCKACLQEKEALKKLAQKPVAPVMVAVTFSRKCCTKCHQEWPQDAVHFRKDAARPDGLMSQCKVCMKAKNKLDVAAKRVKREAARSLVHPDTRMRSFRV